MNITPTDIALDRTILGRIADSLETLTLLLRDITAKPDIEQLTLDEFAQYYFTNFRWRKVTDETKRADLSRYNTHIAPVLGAMALDEIMPKQIQDIIDGLCGKPKTAHEVYGLLHMLFAAAIKHDKIKHNPCDIVYVPTYEKQHGHALTKGEERQLLAVTSGTPYQQMFAVALYTGLRPNEYKTARIDSGFIVARNSKQHDGKEHIKRIPITAMLMQYLTSDGLRFYNVNRIREKFKLILPRHKLYDLRTTFYTRCQECGVSEVARKLFVGHTLGGLADTYTDVSDEYLIKEAQKLDY